MFCPVHKGGGLNLDARDYGCRSGGIHKRVVSDMPLL